MLTDFNFVQGGFGESSKFPKNSNHYLQNINNFNFAWSIVFRSTEKKSENFFEICLIQYFEAAFPMNVASKY